jgi:hypothetical protein
VKLDGDWPAVRAAVRERRAELRLSTAELARRARLSETTVRYFGLGPSYSSTLRQIEYGVGFPRDYLLRVLNGESPEPVGTPVMARLGRIEEKVDELMSLVRSGSLGP